MKKIITIILVLFTFNIQDSVGQTPDWKWTKKAGKAKGERANAVTTDILGNLIVCGELQSSSVLCPNGLSFENSGYGSDIFLIKYDVNGSNPPMARSFGGTDHDVPT